MYTRNGNSHGNIKLVSYDGSSELTRLHIDTAGNVGIGTATPNAYTDYTTLTINHNTNGGILDIERNGNLVGELYTLSATDFGIQTGQATGAMRFRTNAGEVLTLLHTGEVGIGATSPAGIHSLAKVLEISGGDGGDLIIGNNSSANIGAGAHIGAIAFKNIDSSIGTAPHYAGIRSESVDTSGNMDLRFYTGTGNLEADTPQVYVSSGGNVGIGTTSPDQTLTLTSSIGANSSTAFASMDGRIGFDTDYSDSARGPNKILLQNDGNWISGLGISNNYLDIYSGGNIAFHRSTGPDAYTNNMTIQYDGKVGIGTTSPSVGLEVHGDSTGDEISIKYSGTSGGHNSKYLFKDFRGQTNAGIYNNLQDDGVGTAAAHMQFYTSHGGTLSSQMAISRYGHITTPNQPSCSVYNMGFGSSATSWSLAGTGSVNGGLVGVIHHNNGNHYDTSTGYFTAPTDGYYLCNLNVYGKKDNNQGDNSGYWWGYFQKNGGYYSGNYIMEAYYNSGDYDQGASISAIIYLALNDTVRPYMGSSQHGIQVYGPNTGFSCHLLG